MMLSKHLRPPTPGQETAHLPNLIRYKFALVHQPCEEIGQRNQWVSPAEPILLRCRPVLGTRHCRLKCERPGRSIEINRHLGTVVVGIIERVFSVHNIDCFRQLSQCRLRVATDDGRGEFRDLVRRSFWRIQSINPQTSADNRLS